MVCYRSLGFQAAGNVCDWIQSSSVNCGEPADDYTISKEIEILDEAGNLDEHFFLSWKIKVLSGGDEDCVVDSNGYSMVTAGVLLLGGGATLA